MHRTKKIVGIWKIVHTYIKFTGLLGLGLGLLMVGDTVLELLLAAGGLHMLNTDVKALVKDLALDLLVHHHTHGGLGDVPHTAGTAVIVTVGHTLVDGTVDLDVNEVTHLVLGHVGLHGRKTIVTEPLREHVTRVAAHAPSSAAPHLDLCITHAAHTHETKKDRKKKGECFTVSGLRTQNFNPTIAPSTSLGCSILCYC